MSIFLRTKSAGLLTGRSALLRYRTVRNSSGGYYTQNNFEGFGDSIKNQLKSAEKTAIFWKKIFFVAAIPAILGSMWYILIIFFLI